VAVNRISQTTSDFRKFQQLSHFRYTRSPTSPVNIATLHECPLTPSREGGWRHTMNPTGFPITNIPRQNLKISTFNKSQNALLKIDDHERLRRPSIASRVVQRTWLALQSVPIVCAFTRQCVAAGCTAGATLGLHRVYGRSKAAPIRGLMRVTVRDGPLSPISQLWSQSNNIFFFIYSKYIYHSFSQA